MAKSQVYKFRCLHKSRRNWRYFWLVLVWRSLLLCGVGCRPQLLNADTNKVLSPKNMVYKNSVPCTSHKQECSINWDRKNIHWLKLELERIKMQNIWSHNFSQANAIFMHSTEIMELHNRHLESKRNYNLEFVNKLRQTMLSSASGVVAHLRHIML